MNQFMRNSQKHSIHLATPLSREGKGNVKWTANSTGYFSFFFRRPHLKLDFSCHFLITLLIMVLEEVEESEGVLALHWYQKGVFRLFEFSTEVKSNSYCGENMSGKCSICKRN